MEKEFDLLECFDDWTHDICIVCLKICVATGYWVNPTPEFLSIFIDAKPNQELTICEHCLNDLYLGKVRV